MTYKDLFLLIGNINANVGDQTTKGQKKLVKIYEKLKHLIDEYNAKMDDYKLEFASVDDKGNVIVDEKGAYKYTKEGLKSLNAKFKEIENSELVFDKINVVNPAGLEIYTFLENWVTGVEFIQVEQEEEL